jgi:hypothetical protein
MKSRNIRRAHLVIVTLGALLMALLVVACDGVTSADERYSVSLSMALHRAGLALGSADARVTDGQPELVLNNVQLAVENLQLELDDDDDVDDEDTDGGDGDADDEDTEDDDGDNEDDDDADDDDDDEDTEDDDDNPGSGAELLSNGPVLVELPLNGGIITPVTASLPQGRYDEIELVVRRVRVRGLFDGQAFDVDVPVDATVEREFRPPLVIDSDDDRVNVTVAARVAEWFRNRNGALVDPRRVSSDPVLLAQVRRRIATSLSAFEDSDRDGQR